MTSIKEIFKSQGPKIFWTLIGLALLFEIIRDAGRGGDFIGYIQAGDLVLSGDDIYSDPLNTWPPFFSIFSVPLSLLDNMNDYVLRLLWLTLSLIAFIDLGNRVYKMIPLTAKLSYINDYKLGIIIIPFIISFRYLLDNLANIQINIFMLWMVVVVQELILKKQYWKAGFLLAFSISLKVYTIFILFFYVFKRMGKMVFWAGMFLLGLNTIPFLIFGVEAGFQYYDTWWHEIASGPTTVHHKNQSIFGTMQRIFTDQFPGHSYYINLAQWDPEMVKSLTYIIISMAAIIPAYLFRKKSGSTQFTCEWIFVLTAIPVLSPLAWKAYFIFLFPAYWLIHLIINKHLDVSQRKLRSMKVFFWISVGFTVLTSDLFVGKEWSDRMESFSLITIGTIILLILILIVYPTMKRLTPNGFNHN